MSQSNHPSNTTAPDALPALLLYTDALDDRKTYRLSFLAGMWSLAELTMDTVAGGGLRLYSTAVVPTPVLVVEAGADLRTAEDGWSTTVTKRETDR